MSLSAFFSQPQSVVARLPIAFFSLVFSVLFAVGSASAGAPLPSPPLLSAKSYLLIDHQSGTELATKNPDEPIEPASLTKIMTAYIVASEIARGSMGFDDPVIVSTEAQSMAGSRMFIEAGSMITLEDLLRGLIIQSGNDASVALAEHVAASETGFVDMMNRTAERLGMKSTNFTNSSGLPHPDHYTTARDLAVLARAMISEFPEIYSMYSEREFTWNEITQKNRNALLWRDPSVDGMKTGHTESAGYCLIASANRDDMRLISVVLGSGSEKTRIDESQRLLNYGFRFFKTRKIYTAGEPVQQARAWMGIDRFVELGVDEDLYVTLPRDAFDTLHNQIEVAEYIRAPVAIGQELGRSVLKVDEEVVREIPLMSLQKVDEAGLFVRVKDSVLRWFE